MQEYKNLIEALVGMAKISRPRLDLDEAQKSKDQRRTETIQHGICDLLEDAAVAIDDLLQRIQHEERPHAKAA